MIDEYFDQFRLRIKFDKYFNAMRDELIEAINGFDNYQSRKILKSDKLKKVNNEIILMILYCLQPSVRSKMIVLTLDKDEKLPDIILRSIWKCKMLLSFHMNCIVRFLFIDAAVENKAKQNESDSTKHECLASNFDYLLELAIDWDCINTAKEWIVQDSLDNIYDKKSIFCRALTKQRDKFIHYFIQLGLEIDEIFFHPKLNPFAARTNNKGNRRYEEFLKILYTEEAIVCS